MDMTNIVSVISSVGFPIVCCGFFGWYIVKVESKSNDIIQENTNTLTKLVSLIESLMKKIDKE